MKTFTHKSSLDRHYQSCKFNNEVNRDLVTRLSTVNALLREKESCNEKLERELHDYKDHIKRLEDRLEKLASRAIENAKPNITNNTHNKNTYINMLTPLPTQEKLNELIQNGFERKYFVRGQIGLAEFINDSLVRDEENMYYLVCSDTARQVFRFKDQNGNVIKDPCMKQFTNMIAEPVKLKTEEHLRKIEDVDPLYIDRAREIAREFYKLHNDNTELSKAMSSLAPNQTMMID
jgi:hypothetical protein